MTPTAFNAFSSEPLMPTAFLRRAARVCGDRIGVIDGAVRFTYARSSSTH